MTKTKKAAPAVNAVQVGGEHYKKYGDLQPWDLWTMWNLNPFQAAILKYVVRYRDKDGVQDLKKARHFIDKLISVETDNENSKDRQHRQAQVPRARR